MARLQIILLTQNLVKKMWNNGLFLQCGHKKRHYEQAMVIFYPSSMSLFVAVRRGEGEGVSKLMAEVVRGVQGVVDEFYSSLFDEVHQFIPCYRCLSRCLSSSPSSCFPSCGPTSPLLSLSSPSIFPSNFPVPFILNIVSEIAKTQTTLTRQQTTVVFSLTFQEKGVVCKPGEGAEGEGELVTLFSAPACRRSVNEGNLDLDCLGTKVSVGFVFFCFCFYYSLRFLLHQEIRTQIPFSNSFFFFSLYPRLIAPDIALADAPFLQVHMKEKLGEGAQGTVHKALSLTTSSTSVQESLFPQNVSLPLLPVDLVPEMVEVAVKSLRTKANQTHIETFFREIHVMSLRKHPNLLQMLG